MHEGSRGGGVCGCVGNETGGEASTLPKIIGDSSQIWYA